MPLEKSELSRGALASYYAQYLVLRGLIGGMRMLPYDTRIAAMGRLMRTLGPLVGFSKRIRDNLALTCPDLTCRQRLPRRPAMSRAGGSGSCTCHAPPSGVARGPLC